VSDTPSVYGPLFTIVSAPLSAIGNGLYAFRTVAALSAVALAVLAWRLSPRRKALAAAFVGWNPLVALHSAGGGHNDALMMVLVVTALGLAVHRPRAGGAAWAVAIALKWIPLALLPLHLLAGAAPAGARRRGARGGGRSPGSRGPHSGRAGWRRSASSPTKHTETSMSTGASSVFPNAALALGAAIVGGYAWLLRTVWRGRAGSRSRPGCSCSTPWLLPWYVV
jgi:hypothetical protein